MEAGGDILELVAGSVWPLERQSWVLAVVSNWRELDAAAEKQGTQLTPKDHAAGTACPSSHVELACPGLPAALAVQLQSPATNSHAGPDMQNMHRLRQFCKSCIQPPGDQILVQHAQMC